MKANAFDLGKGFAPKVDVDLWVDARGKHKGGMSIGEEYYETDPWSKQEDAINELKGCWGSVKEKVETAFNDIGKEKYADEHPDIEAIKAIEDHAYFAGSEAMREKMTNKACEWLKENWRKHVWLDGDNIIHFGLWENDFRKAMEGCI